jgi:hypothetical protein
MVADHVIACRRAGLLRRRSATDADDRFDFRPATGTGLAKESRNRVVAARLANRAAGFTPVHHAPLGASGHEIVERALSLARLQGLLGAAVSGTGSPHHFLGAVAAAGAATIRYCAGPTIPVHATSFDDLRSAARERGAENAGIPVSAATTLTLAACPRALRTVQTVRRRPTKVVLAGPAGPTVVSASSTTLSPRPALPGAEPLAAITATTIHASSGLAFDALAACFTALLQRHAAAIPAYLS